MVSVWGWSGRVEQIMGLPIAIDVRDPAIAPAALDRVFAWLRWVDATFSTYKPDSELSRLNRGELALAEAHPELRAVLERCAALRAETAGYFDAEAALLAQWGRLGDAALRLGPWTPQGWSRAGRCSA